MVRGVDFGFGELDFFAEQIEITSVLILPLPGNVEFTGNRYFLPRSTGLLLSAGCI